MTNSKSGGFRSRRGTLIINKRTRSKVKGRDIILSRRNLRRKLKSKRRRKKIYLWNKKNYRIR